MYSPARLRVSDATPGWDLVLSYSLILLEGLHSFFNVLGKVFLSEYRFAYSNLHKFN